MKYAWLTTSISTKRTALETAVNLAAIGWALLGVKIETSMNRLATFHKVGPGRGEHDGEKSFRIGSLICLAVCARSYA